MRAKVLSPYPVNPFIGNPGLSSRYESQKLNNGSLGYLYSFCGERKRGWDAYNPIGPYNFCHLSDIQVSPQVFNTRGTNNKFSLSRNWNGCVLNKTVRSPNERFPSHKETNQKRVSLPQRNNAHTWTLMQTRPVSLQKRTPAVDA